jgi:hypothetical protein
MMLEAVINNANLEHQNSSTVLGGFALRYSENLPSALKQTINYDESKLEKKLKLKNITLLNHESLLNTSFNSPESTIGDFK